METPCLDAEWEQLRVGGAWVETHWLWKNDKGAPMTIKILNKWKHDELTKKNTETKILQEKLNN